MSNVLVRFMQNSNKLVEYIYDLQQYSYGMSYILLSQICAYICICMSIFLCIYLVMVFTLIRLAKHK